MDGRGRALDNIFVERLWRNVKYEDIYLKGYGSMTELAVGLNEYFAFYNNGRPHQALGYRTPDVVYRTAMGGGAVIMSKYPPPMEESTAPLRSGFLYRENKPGRGKSVQRCPAAGWLCAA
jgi:putative transposase